MKNVNEKLNLPIITRIYSYINNIRHNVNKFNIGSNYHRKFEGKNCNQTFRKLNNVHLTQTRKQKKY